MPWALEVHLCGDILVDGHADLAAATA